MLVLIVSHFSNDFSNVAELIVLIKNASYFSLRSVSIFDNAGNGFLENKTNRLFKRKTVSVCCNKAQYKSKIILK